MKLASHNQCTGCTACYAVCPHNAISIVPDEEGFVCPRVDEEKCLHCGLCERVCPSMHPREPRKPQAVYAAKARDEALRFESSSGGVFSLLAKAVLRDGGVVFGAAFDQEILRVYHKSIENEKDLPEIRGSKYVQSEMRNCLKQVSDALMSGRVVLISGTPCQIAGARRYVEGAGLDDARKANIFYVEVICNSVSSPSILTAFIHSTIKEPETSLKDVVFRDKSEGWKGRTLKMLTARGVYKSSDSDVYYGLWQQGYTVRECCRDCKFRAGRSGADLTIGDAWGVEDFAPELSDGKGTSVILVNGETGRELLCRIKDDVVCTLVDYADVVTHNPAVKDSPIYLNNAGTRRRKFWNAVMKGGNVVELGRKYLRQSLLKKVLRRVGRIFCRTMVASAQ